MCYQLLLLRMSSSAACATPSSSNSEITFPASRHQESWVNFDFHLVLDSSGAGANIHFSVLVRFTINGGASGTTTSPIPSDSSNVVAGVGISVS